MYETLLYLHSWFRWIILLLFLIIITRSVYGWATSLKYTSPDSRLSSVFLVLFDIQFLLGLILYFAFSPYTLTAFGNFGNAMKDPVLRFWAVEHILTITIALAVCHIGNSRVKKNGKDAVKFKLQTIFYLIAFILILSMIPWAESARLFRGIS
ncbi:MAG TPA: hypothetical protein VI583_17180 [Cyclobacteriaceae bacterium]|nr:hypothetical protein [Cyclobacteriaceae bacterium]